MLIDDNVACEVQLDFDKKVISLLVNFDFIQYQTVLILKIDSLKAYAGSRALHLN